MITNVRMSTCHSHSGLDLPFRSTDPGLVTRPTVVPSSVFSLLSPFRRRRFQKRVFRAGSARTARAKLDHGFRARFFCSSDDRSALERASGFYRAKGIARLAARLRPAVIACREAKLFRSRTADDARRMCKSRYSEPRSRQLRS